MYNDNKKVILFCEIIINHWLLPTMLETTNSRTQGSLHFVQIANTDGNEQRYFYSILNWKLLVCMLSKFETMEQINNGVWISNPLYIRSFLCSFLYITVSPFVRLSFSRFIVYPLAILYSSCWHLRLPVTSNISSNHSYVHITDHLLGDREPTPTIPT